VLDLVHILSNPESKKAQETGKKIVDQLFKLTDKQIEEIKQNVKGVIMNNCEVQIDRHEDEEDIEFYFSIMRKKQPITVEGEQALVTA